MGCRLKNCCWLIVLANSSSIRSCYSCMLVKEPNLLDYFNKNKIHLFSLKINSRQMETIRTEFQNVSRIAVKNLAYWVHLILLIKTLQRDNFNIWLSIMPMLISSSSVTDYYSFDSFSINSIQNYVQINNIITFFCKRDRNLHVKVHYMTPFSR